MRKIFIYLFSIIFFLITGINILFPKIAYQCYIYFSFYSADTFLLNEDIFYFCCTIIFIIMVIDIIISLWKNIKLKERKIDLCVVTIFMLLNIFSSPICYISDNNINDENNVYRFDTFLSYAKFSTNDHEGGPSSDVYKYIYIPFVKKIILFGKNKVKIITFRDGNYSINYDYPCFC